MFRKRERADQNEPDLLTQTQSPSQEVWDAGRRELNVGMSMLLAGEAAVREDQPFASNERLEIMLSHLTSAMYSFEILIERKAHLEIVEPLAEGCRRLSEGLLNGDGTELFEGRRLIWQTMVPIEEEQERRQRES